MKKISWKQIIGLFNAESTTQEDKKKKKLKSCHYFPLCGVDGGGGAENKSNDKYLKLLLRCEGSPLREW